MRYHNRFLRLLVENLHLPAYCLVDCDPYGFDILTTYRFGSMVSILNSSIPKLLQHLYHYRVLNMKYTGLLEWIESLPKG